MSIRHTVRTPTPSSTRLNQTGGYPKFVAGGFNENYLPVWLQKAGYNTYYTGKLFNVHTTENYNSPFAAGFTGNVRLRSTIWHRTRRTDLLITGILARSLHVQLHEQYLSKEY